MSLFPPRIAIAKYCMSILQLGMPLGCHMLGTCTSERSLLSEGSVASCRYVAQALAVYTRASRRHKQTGDPDCKYEAPLLTRGPAKSHVAGDPTHTHTEPTVHVVAECTQEECTQAERKGGGGGSEGCACRQEGGRACQHIRLVTTP